MAMTPIEDLDTFRSIRRDAIAFRINEAIRLVRNIPELSRITGIPVATLRKWAKGTTEPPGSALIAIAYASGLHPHWLLTGQGPKHQSDELWGEGEVVYINNLLVEAAAGDGANVGSEVINDRMAFRKDWLSRHSLQPEHLCFITARGDSMEPTIRTGDTLLVSVYQYNAGSADKQRLKHGLPPGKRSGKEGIFVLRMDGGLVVKRLQPDPGKGYIVRSDNSEYRPLEISADDVDFVGRVEWIGRRL